MSSLASLFQKGNILVINRSLRLLLDEEKEIVAYVTPLPASCESLVKVLTGLIGNILLLRLAFELNPDCEYPDKPLY